MKAHELSDGLQAQRVISRWLECQVSLPLDGSTSAEAYQKGLLLESQTEPHRSPTPLRVEQEHENVLNGALAA